MMTPEEYHELMARGRVMAVWKYSVQNRMKQKQECVQFQLRIFKPFRNFGP